MRSRATLALVLLLGCSGCAGRVAIPSAPAAEPLRTLERLLAGSFSSARQAAEDASFFDIRLHMAPIWSDRGGGPWLYVEQARADALDRPYRQRVYRLSAREADGATEYVSEVFELPGDPLRFAGAWEDPSSFATIAPADLVPRAGCEVVLRAIPEGFEGATVGKRCPSSLRGAAYATSEVRITDQEIVSWDRGFDESDRQVWGAERGGYRFLRE